ncbi:MAG: hypothetical protein WD490_00280 [Opitutales bacterium]
MARSVGPEPGERLRQSRTAPDGAASPQKEISVHEPPSGVRVSSLKIVLGACWLLAMGAAFFGIARYENTSGETGFTPGHWPVDTAAKLDERQRTLLLFAHPACPCTRASIEQLNRLLAKTGGKVAAQVWFYAPDPLPRGWSQSDLRRAATAIPGVTVHDDFSGEQARRFGAETSGQVVLYDAAGDLIFKGGITASRGHSGDNAGTRTILASLKDKPDAYQQTPVFGCSLLGDCTAAPEPEI